MERKKRNHILAMMLLVTVVFTLGFSALFVAQHGDHVCAGERCPVCLHIVNIRELLSKLGCVCLAVLAVLMLQDSFLRIEADSAALCKLSTLVSLHVKLSD